MHTASLDPSHRKIKQRRRESVSAAWLPHWSGFVPPMPYTEVPNWIFWLLEFIGALICLIGWFVWREIRRIGRNLHDTNNFVDRHEKWITIIRERLGIGPRRDE